MIHSCGGSKDWMTSPATKWCFKNTWHVLHMIWNMSCPSAPPVIRDWIQTASGWNRWGRMEMEPSTGTSMVLVCTKRSRSRGKQRRAGRWPLFSAQSTKRYCQVTGSVCVLCREHVLSVWLYLDMFLQVCFNYSSLSLLITLVKKAIISERSFPHVVVPTVNPLN